jgi:monoamine oxidase
MDSRDEHEAHPTRRDVIVTGGAAGVIAGVDAIVGSSHAQSGKQPHVVIVGAGLAGLCAAYLLQQKGWTYTILEAERKHVGGRVRTMPIGNGLYWDAGAMRIPKNHKITRKYVKEFSELELRPFVMFSSKTFYFARGQKALKEDEIRKLFKLTPAEANRSSEQFWNLGVRDIAKGVRKDGLSLDEQKELEFSNSFTSKKLIELDRLSLRQMLETRQPPDTDPLSDEAIEYILFAYGNLAIQHGASTEFLREELTDVWVQGFSEIVGGSSRLPEAFLRRLKSRPRMGCEVIRLEQDAPRNRVRAVYQTGGTVAREEGDFLLCTIPFPVLVRVDADPPFSFEKRRAILELGYDSGTKVVLLTRNRFWEKNDEIFGGSTTTDLMTGPIIYPSDNAPNDETGKKSDPSVTNGPGVLMASYTWGQDARRLAAMPATEREEFATKQAALVHPELKQRGMIIGRSSWAWDNYRWSGGAFALYQPGQFARIHQHVVAPEGRIYFAGEHCSRSHSWMQGALESAEVAVNALATRYDARQ